MRRELDLKTGTDGKKYSFRDMAKLGCNDCFGCSDCCKSVDDTIVLDPWDVFNLSKATKLMPVELNGRYMELGVVDGVILPHISMSKGACGFLNEKGRCSIHELRPGFCRLYPLGRLYENEDYSYVLLTNQCIAQRTTKVKISKWLELENPKAYHDFIVKWHYFIKQYQDCFVNNTSENEMEEAKNVSLKILKHFYLTPYNTDADFYAQFESRMESF